MNSTTDSRQLIDGAAKARFLERLRDQASGSEAAQRAGFLLSGFYSARRRDPLFRLAWDWARELAAIDRMADRQTGSDDAPFRIGAHNARLLQRRQMPGLKFTEERQQIFLDHFAGTADATTAAAEAGISRTSLYAYRRSHPEFAAAWNHALAEAVSTLEAEAVRQRLATQQRLIDNLEPAGEMAAEFDRVLKLLARWDRLGGRTGAREIYHGRLKRWSFDDAIEALDKKLDALGVRQLALPAPRTEEQ